MANEHTSQDFEAELRQVRERALAMGVLCEAAVSMAFRAFWEGKPELASRVPQVEAQLDKDEIAIEALVLRVIALRQPVAGDLRFLAGALRLATDLERVGDAAVKITECTVSERGSARALVAAELQDMDGIAQGMLRGALQAFVERDADGAREVLECDDAVDRRCAEIIAKMTDYVAAHSDDVAAGLRVMWVARYLERIADHATNVAEEVIFIVRGDDVRHAGVAPDGTR